ncbi:MAG: YmdB family metallophosphoesterase [Puniceicoccales bacterium]|jgi:metallophosphoesterase (TIGR00282 family)|nr:YmdB family metallophosphoesterase [Puniceicoccales bacterium]
MERKIQSSLRILYLGDLVGRPAREAIVANLDGIRRTHGIDVVVANGENATSGAGITRAHAELLHHAGVDAITLGDHVWDRTGFDVDIDGLPYVCRPANLPRICPGKNFVTIENGGTKIGICLVLGRNFMKIHASCAFEAVENLLKNNGENIDIFLVEVHAEATSEKIALGWNFDGKVSAIVGTHTHVQTADERILPNGTAYITDLGMCGPHESVIGREISPVLYSMKFGIPQRFDVATNDVRLNGVVLTFDGNSKRAVKIARFSEKIS